jgi:hypothetical protein
VTLEKFRESVTDHIGELTEDKLMKHVCNYNNSIGLFKILVENGKICLATPAGDLMVVEKNIDNILSVMLTVMTSGGGVRWEM